MLLKGQDGSSLELTINGYEFPEVTNDEFESNSLIICVEIMSPNGSWKFTDAIMMTWEAINLARWLRSVALDLDLDVICQMIQVITANDIEFVEPNIRFTVINRAEERTVLRIYFELEARPEWAASVTANRNDFWVDLMVSRGELELAASVLHHEVINFPVRGPVGICAED